MREAHSVELARSPVALRVGWVTACLRSVLAGLWFVLIPAVFSGLALRYLVLHSVSATGLEGAFASFGREHTLLCALLVFLLATALIRYWRAWLPGGRYLSSLPTVLVQRVPQRRVQACEQACALLDWLESPAGKRWLARSTTELASQVTLARAALSEQLASGKWSRVALACARLRELIGEADSAGALKSASFAALLVLAVVLALALRSTFFQSYEVIGRSMLPSLAAGDLLAGKVLSSAQSAGALERGDIVVLRVTVDGTVQEIIKRVIGLPGDHIGMRGVHPIINGWPVPVCDAGAYYSPEDQTAIERRDPGGRVALEFLAGHSYLTFQAAPGLPFSDYVVKPGELFVLGDNRNNSRDSRSFEDGAPRGFPLTDVKAKVDRVLLGRTRRGEIDPASVWKPLGLALHLDTLNVSEEQTGIAACLAARPSETNPPSAIARVGLASGAP